jgi:integral membrane protein (TIGR01906 family)
MDIKKEVRKLRLLPLTLALAFVFFASALFVVSNLRPLYLSLFDRYEVYSNFEIQDKEELDRKFFTVLDYLSLGQNRLDVNFYSREDLLHLVDVRNLFIIVYSASVAAAFIVTGYLFFLKLSRSELIMATRNATAIIFAFILMAGIIASSNFHPLFVRFHELTFTNSYWELDPATSNLIKFLPEVIFRDLFVILLVLTFVIGLSAFITGTILLQRKNDAKQRS